MSALNPEKYRFRNALRPFSLSVSLITCGTGLVAGSLQGEWSLVRAVAVVLAGVLLQAACNLANDQADLRFLHGPQSEPERLVYRRVQQNIRWAVLFTTLASLLGLWLVVQVGWPLLLLGGVGLLFGYFYTGEPIIYKHRGLGVPAVFLLTGVLMVVGSCFALTGSWSTDALLLSLPVSLLTSSLLLSNELRDFVEDQRQGIGTLTVRIGYAKSRLLYLLSLLIVYPVAGLLCKADLIKEPAYLLFSVPMLWFPLRMLKTEYSHKELRRLPEWTGRFFLIFGLFFLASILAR